LLNRETGELELVACYNVDEEQWKVPGWKDRGFTAAVVKDSRPFVVTNLQTDPRTQAPDFFRGQGLVSYLGVPLVAKEDTLGALSFYTREEHEFGDDEVKFLSALAAQAATAIQNSQLYEQTKKQAGALERADKVKSEFLSVMSHELRTPLNVIMGYSGMVKDRMFGEVTPEQERALEKVVRYSDDLLSMITSILEVTTLEAQAVRLESREVDLGQFLSELRSNYDGTLKKEVALIWDYPENLPILRTDRKRLGRIVVNLIDNAIKFTEKGSVTVSVRTREEPAGSRQIEFKVADTGVGIPRDALPIIFEMFRQADSSETRIYGGIGLGLYIVQRLATLLGGRVEVESEPGRGSTFTVVFPCGA